MITLEAFITKKNLKQAVDANNKLQYDDIRFHNAMKKECDELFNRIKEKDLLPKLKTVNGDKVMDWHVTNRSWGKGAIYPVLEAVCEHTSTVDGKTSTYTTHNSVMFFAIENKDDDYIYFTDRFDYYEHPTKELENEFTECDKIAKAMGFIHYSEKYGKWTKTIQ